MNVNMLQFFERAGASVSLAGERVTGFALEPATPGADVAMCEQLVRSTLANVQRVFSTNLGSRERPLNVILNSGLHDAVYLPPNNLVLPLRDIDGATTTFVHQQAVSSSADSIAHEIGHGVVDERVGWIAVREVVEPRADRAVDASIANEAVADIVAATTNRTLALRVGGSVLRDLGAARAGVSHLGFPSWDGTYSGFLDAVDAARHASHDALPPVHARYFDQHSGVQHEASLDLSSAFGTVVQRDGWDVATHVARDVIDSLPDARSFSTETVAGSLKRATDRHASRDTAQHLSATLRERRIL